VAANLASSQHHKQQWQLPCPPSASLLCTVANKEVKQQLSGG
jgi:hypothetical protein